MNYLHRRSKQQNRTVFYVMLSTLLWTDLIGKLTTTPAAILAYVHGHWLGGVSTVKVLLNFDGQKEACNLHGFTMMTIGLVTHCMVSAMAVERYIGIRHGYYYSKHVTTSRARLLLLGIWLFGVLLCAMPLFGVGQYALQYPGSWCFVNTHVLWDESPVQHIVFTNLYGSIHVLCIVTIVYCNFAVIDI
ncbi:hypothetical protein HAZT_HAZT003853 [Hyalella azteca]|uniref:G-protein coupled receptors family 1 profile domain-containing protein n=1 Tax=Hyalella azteca TaxID=294128 RepID=A0A6A0GXH4_HYAAZ|nr:hypothetical protein HAZT_HAZT003853 [Hyalella azteca]